MIKIIIIDDHKLFSDGLAKLLETDAEFQVITQIFDSRNAISELQKTHADVLLIDFKMPYINGLELSRLILERNQNQKILILSMYDEERFIKEFKEAGVRGYLIKTAALEEVKKAIIDIQNNQLVFEKLQIENNNPYNEDDFLKKLSLSPREKEVVKLMKQGQNTRQIADNLNISYYTAETHRKNIYTKLGIKGGERSLLNQLYQDLD
jgi:DNA-binding NarL/FixJ family response regulator